MGSSVRVEFDIRRLNDRLQTPIRRAQIALDQQIIKDSNYYCPQDQGGLQNSAILAWNDGKTGEVVWETDYARKQYYELPNKSHDPNPNARMKWFHEAKAEHLEDWERIAQDGLNG